jgi:hypothetical protein
MVKENKDPTSFLLNQSFQNSSSSSTISETPNEIIRRADLL